MILAIVLFVVAVLVAATVLALLEIQIEGRSGWAAELPTWRVENRWTRIFNNGKALTGYHFFLNLLLLTLLNVPFLLGEAFSVTLELRIIAFVLLLWTVEDFLWFVLNPAYGIKRFKKERIPWHTEWWGIAPREYWILVPIGIILYVLSLAL